MNRMKTGKTAVFHVNAVTARSNKADGIYERCVTAIQTYRLSLIIIKGVRFQNLLYDWSYENFLVIGMTKTVLAVSHPLP